MAKATRTSVDYERLKRDRDIYDRRYNDALTALDAAILRTPPDLPAPPPAFDERQVAPINDLWRIAPEGVAFGTGWRARLRRFVWQIVGPVFDEQRRFNAALVEHVNRNVATHRETAAALGRLIPLVESQIGALASFQSQLVQWAQEITGYVDTRDRDIGGRLTAGLEAATDTMEKRWESMSARERRLLATERHREARLDEVQTTMALVQQSSMTLKREIERLMAGSASAGTGAGAVPSSPAAVAPASRLDAYKYVGFEDRFRGSRQEIRARLQAYLPDFAGATDVLDLGCGRGEFLALLRERGVAARGVDLNHEMVEVCRAQGFDVSEGDALGYLDALPDASLGGLFAAQVVEHLEPGYLMRLLETAYHKLRPGSKIVIETINPSCWYAFFESYLRDFTHVRPLHPDTLVFLLTASGFQRAGARYSAPYPEAGKLRHVKAPSLPADLGGDELAALAATLNDNATILNRLLFTYLDYAAVGEKA